MLEVEDAIRRNSIALSSRLSALAIYGIMGILIGTTMALFGAPAVVEAMFGADIRYWLGISCAVGGVLLSIGAILDGGATSRKGWLICLAGVIVFGAWAAAMATTYGIVALREDMVIAQPGVPVEPGQPLAYVPFVYQGLSLLTILHLITLLRLKIPPR